MCRQTKSVEDRSTKLQDPRLHLLDNDSATPYESPSSLLSTSDADVKSSATWHTPRGSPRHENLVGEREVDHLQDGDRGPAAEATSSNDMVDDTSSPVCVLDHELTSSGVTATPLEPRTTDISLHSDGERGRYMSQHLLEIYQNTLPTASLFGSYLYRIVTYCIKCTWIFHVNHLYFLSFILCFVLVR